MDPNEYLRRPLIEVLVEMKGRHPLIDYSLVESDEFLKLPEAGVFFYAEGDGLIRGYRIYYTATSVYFPASTQTRAACLGISTLESAFERLGKEEGAIPSVHIPGVPPTNPGYKFSSEDRSVLVHYDAGTREITYVHVMLDT